MVVSGSVLWFLGLPQTVLPAPRPVSSDGFVSKLCSAAASSATYGDSANAVTLFGSVSTQLLRS